MDKSMSTTAGAYVFACGCGPGRHLGVRAPTHPRPPDESDKLYSIFKAHHTTKEWEEYIFADSKSDYLLKKKDVLIARDKLKPMENIAECYPQIEETVLKSLNYSASKLSASLRTYGLSGCSTT
jgi:hypothetical protein